MTRTKENYEKVMTAIAQAEAGAIERGTYKLPSRSQIGMSVGLDDYLYAHTEGGRKAKAEYNAAQTRLALKRAEVPVLSVTSIDSPYSPVEVETVGDRVIQLFEENQALKQQLALQQAQPDPCQERLENERLRAEIEALRAERQQVPISSDAALLQALKDEDRKLRSDAAKLLDRITEMEQCRCDPAVD